MEYYTYAYLREDGTPYYIGKGKGYRINQKTRTVPLPPKDRRVKLKTGLTSQEAIDEEVKLIAQYGRKDIGTGILRNMTDGGDGTPGWRMSEEQRHRCKFDKTGVHPSEETRQKLREARKSYIHTPESNKKRSETLKGRTISEETRAKMRLAAKERCRKRYNK